LALLKYAGGEGCGGESGNLVVALVAYPPPSVVDFAYGRMERGRRTAPST
jgi:hypothetical protein